MIDGKRVVAFTPYGRERTVSILERYLRRERERGVLDEWWLCLNTDPTQISDLTYGLALARGTDWVKARKRPQGRIRLTPKQRNTGYFYEYMTDPDTIYVRFDDDIVYLHPDALERLVRARIALQGSTLTAFATIWNNATVSYHMQQQGKIPTEFGKVESPYCMEPTAWGNGDFAVRIHGLFLDLAEKGPERLEDLYLYQDIPLEPGKQFSVSCFACSGVDYAALNPPGVLDYPEEEHWHTIHRPVVTEQSNILVGNALVSHLTFMYQQKAVLATNVLDRYRALANQI